MKVPELSRPLAGALVCSGAVVAGALAVRASVHKSRPVGGPRVVVLGLGYCGCAIARELSLSLRCEVSGTTRGRPPPGDIRSVGVQGLDMSDVGTLSAKLRDANVIVATAPPGDAGDPFLAVDKIREAVGAAAAGGGLIIYLSSVGVYGDQGGELVTEGTVPAPKTARAKRRLAAEEQWRATIGVATAARLAIVRLPGIYGPGRGPLAKAREGNTRIVKEGHVFSRIHAEDVALFCGALVEKMPHGVSTVGLWACGGCEVFNCCDSEPAAQHEVTALAYELLGRPVPPGVPFDSAELSAMQRSFYEESRHMDNKKILNLLGTLRYPSYKTGLPACLEQEAAADSKGFFLLTVLGSIVQRANRTVSGVFARKAACTRVALIDNGSLRAEATLSLRRLAADLTKLSEASGLPMHVEAVSARFADRVPERELDGRPAEILPGWLQRVSAESPGSRVLLLPLLVGPATTLTKTMPSAARAVSGLEVEIAPSLVFLCPALAAPGASGVSEVAGILVDRLAELPRSLAGTEETRPLQILLCDHGSPVERVASAREAVRKELSKQLGMSVTGCCMERREGPDYDFNGPLLEDVLPSLPQGARVAVALLFLQEGKHAGAGGDIATIVAGVQEKRPDLQILTTPVMAGHPSLLKLLLQRSEQGVPLRLWA